MPVHTKEQLESILTDVLEAQKDLARFIKSKSSDTLIMVLMLHTACQLILDDREDENGNDFRQTLSEMGSRIDAIIDLGHTAILKSLQEGNYEQLFGMSVELAVLEESHTECEHCLEQQEEDTQVLDRNLN